MLALSALLRLPLATLPPALTTITLQVLAGKLPVNHDIMRNLQVSGWGLSCCSGAPSAEGMPVAALTQVPAGGCMPPCGSRASRPFHHLSAMACR